VWRKATIFKLSLGDFEFFATQGYRWYHGSTFPGQITPIGAAISISDSND